jgi:hypothetical protein
MTNQGGLLLTCDEVHVYLHLVEPSSLGDASPARMLDPDRINGPLKVSQQVQGRRSRLVVR